MYQVIDTEKEEPKLHNAMQEWAEEDVIFYLHYGNQYSAYDYKEFLDQVRMWKDDNQITDLELTEDNIQAWTYNNQDYYRLTFTSERMPRVSRTELVFNRLVMGLTYIVKKADYEKHQDELFSKLRGEPTQEQVPTVWMLGKIKSRNDKKFKCRIVAGDAL